MSLMNNNDRQEQANAIRQKIADAVKANDAAAFSAALTEYGQCIEENILAEAAKDADAKIKAATQSIDAEVLRSRGVRQLTSTEAAYWQKVADAMKSSNPKQALEDLDVVMPETIIDSVFEDLRANHPLLNAVNFRAVSGHVRMMMNTDGVNKAQWGELCDEIVKPSSLSATPCWTSAPSGWTGTSARFCTRRWPTAWRTASSTATATSSPSA